MWFIGVEVEQETSAPPPKKNPGSAPAVYAKKKLSTQDVYDVFVIFSNVSFLALPGDFWVAPNGVFSNSRQSLHVSGTGIADFNPSRDYGFLELSQFPKPWIPESTPRNFPDSGFERFPEICNPFYLTLGNWILWGFNLEEIDSLWQFLSRSVAKRTDRFSLGVQSELSSSFITVGGMICYLGMELKVRKKLSVTEKVPELLEKNWSSIKRRQLLLFLSADCITCSEFSLRKLDQLS